MKVFISHRSVDKSWAERLARALREQGIDAWLDKWEIKPGESIIERINESLAESEYLLLILTPDSVDASARWVQTEWQPYLSNQLSRGEVAARLIPLLLRDAEIPMVLRHIKYIDFRDDATFDERFIELYDALHNISARPEVSLDGVDDVRRKIRLARYQEAADALAVLEEAAERLVGRSMSIIPGQNQPYPFDESLAMFRRAFARLQQISRNRWAFSNSALVELERTVAMIETMNLDFEDESIKWDDKQRLRDKHRKYLEQRLGSLVGERNRAFCAQMINEFGPVDTTHGTSRSGVHQNDA